MRTIKNSIASVLPALIISVLLLLVTDFFFGSRLMARFQDTDEAEARKEVYEKKYRVSHPVYHHALAPNFDGEGMWGGKTYRVCTNSFGLKDRCDRTTPDDKVYDVAFIGDSFGEGIGLPYEQTFVGKVAAALPNLRIANFSVASYSPSIYLVKTRELLSEGIRFRELIVMVDISDIQDEAVHYAIEDGMVHPVDPLRGTAIDTQATSYGIKRRLEQMFPLTYLGMRTLKTWIVNPEYARQKAFVFADRSAWTYDPSVGGYGAMGIEGAIKKSVLLMTDLYELLQEKGIAMSVMVYPWPSQLRFDKVDSRQVRIWREFCKGRCRNFYDEFPVFFDAAATQGVEPMIDRYFVKGDVHHTEMGEQLMATDFLKAYSPL